VEPNANLIPALSQEAARLDPNAVHKPVVVNAAICPQGGQRMTLYVPDTAAILADFALYRVLTWLRLFDPAWMSEVASLDYERAASSLKAFFSLPHVKKEFIQELPIRCATPADLISEVGASAQDVAYLAIDAEGFDAQLLALFLELRDFSPALVQFEWFGHHGNETSKVAALSGVSRALHARGYELRKEGENLVARVTDNAGPA